MNKLNENLQNEYSDPLDLICKWVDEGEILLRKNSNYILDSKKIDLSLEIIETTIRELEVIFFYKTSVFLIKHFWNLTAFLESDRILTFKT